MKRICIAVFGGIAVIVMLMSGIQWLVADIIGVWSKLPSRTNRLANYHVSIKDLHNEIAYSQRGGTVVINDIMRLWMVKLRYESSLVAVIRELMMELDSRNQLHDGNISNINVDHYPGNLSDI